MIVIVVAVVRLPVRLAVLAEPPELLVGLLVAVVVRLAAQLAVEPVAVPVAVLDVLAAEPELLVKYEAMEGLEMLDDHVRMQQQGSVFPVHQQPMELHMHARLNAMEEAQDLDKMQDQGDE